MSNIFEGASFCDIYKTVNNKVARFICVTKFTEYDKFCLYVEGEDVPFWYDENGESLLNKKEFNIVPSFF